MVASPCVLRCRIWGLERIIAGMSAPRYALCTAGGSGNSTGAAYSSAGFIWDNVMAHGKTLRDYGEFAITETHWRDKSKKRAPSASDYYRDFVNQTDAIEIGCRPTIESFGAP